jgi:hypothetical protein
VIGYDSDNLDDIPSSIASDPSIVLNYYDDGEPGTATPAQLARFATTHRYSITRTPNVVAYWADIESGTMSIAQAVQCLKDNTVTGLYIAESNWASLRQAVARALLPPPPYWVAAYPTTTPTNPAVPPSWVTLGCVQWQYVDPPNSGGHYDISVTAPGFPPPPVVLPNDEDDMTFGTIDVNGKPCAAIFYASPVGALVGWVQTSGTGPYPTGTWEWFDMTNPQILTNGPAPTIA